MPDARKSTKTPEELVLIVQQCCVAVRDVVAQMGLSRIEEKAIVGAVADTLLIAIRIDNALLAETN